VKRAAGVVAMGCAGFVVAIVWPPAIVWGFVVLALGGGLAWTLTRGRR
jgi:hypothetical protein